MTPMMDPDHPGYSDEGYRNPAFGGVDCGEIANTPREVARGYMA
jgi:hypothetical protein